MSEKLRSNWFVVLIVIVLVGFTGYFIYDMNRDNVKGRQSDGKDVIASITDKDITADELYESGEPFDGSLIYNLYKNAVISQTVETTDALEKSAKEMERTIDSNVKNASSDNYKEVIASELAGYGFNGYDQLYDYCLVAAKEKEMNSTYVKEHFDELKKAVEEKDPRLVSQIVINVADPENLTEDEQNKLDAVDKALEGGSFADAVTAFSEDTATVEEKGFAGYIDQDTASAGSQTVNAQAAAAALKLKKDEVTEWIPVTNSPKAAHPAQSCLRV